MEALHPAALAFPRRLGARSRSAGLLVGDVHGRRASSRHIPEDVTLMANGTWRPCPDDLIDDLTQMDNIRWTKERPAPDAVVYLVAYLALFRGTPRKVRGLADWAGIGRHRANDLMIRAAKDLAERSGDKSGTNRGQPTTVEPAVSQSRGDKSGTQARAPARSSSAERERETDPPKPPQGGAPQDSGRSRGNRRRGGTSVVQPEPPPWTRDKDARSFDFGFMLDNSPGVLTQEQLNGAYAYAHEHGYPLPVYPAHIWESSGLVCPDAQPAQPANVIAFPGR